MDLQEQVIQAFQIEHKEQVTGIRTVLGSLEQQGPVAGDPRWDDAFRMAHTLKGGARVCGLRPVEALGHRMESLFAGVREGKLTFDKKIADALYRALDTIEDGMAALAAGGPIPSPDDALTMIENLIGEAQPPAATPPVTVAAPTAPPSVPDDAAPAITVDQTAAPSAETGPSAKSSPATTEAAAPAVGVQDLETLRVPTRHLDHVVRSTDAFFALHADHERVTGELGRLTAQVRELERECETVRATAAPVLRRLNSMSEFARVGRHVETVARQVHRLSRQLRLVRGLQQRGSWTLGVVSDDVRRAVKQVRMVSAENVLQGLRPMVRNLARDEGKEVEFRAVGLDVQADRMVLQALKDPLMHALRNAVVHGLEAPRERQAQRKDRTGRIDLTLRTQGNRLHVQVEDDGRGIDFGRVAREAEGRGFLQDASAGTESAREQLCRVLFRPGFSTSDSVNELAGRGMGLSVVHETIVRLRGGVRIGPRRGSGTLLEMTLPLFVSTERLLVVAGAGQLFALPIHGIERLLHLRPADVQRLDGHDVTLVEDAPLPLVNLAIAVGCAEAPAPPRNDVLSIVVLRSATRRVGLIVDAFHSEHAGLIRDLDGPAAEVAQFCGAVLLSDNEVALVINPGELAEHLREGTSARPANVPTRPKTTPTVLVVDDSFTTRTLEKSILETNGFNVRVAVDGVEAWTVLGSEPIDIVIADVQMPRMDGLTLLKQIRDDEKLESLPVILVTSLDRPQDRQRGLDLGANAYIVKRQFDHHDLLNTIQAFL